jgi:transposase
MWPGNAADVKSLIPVMDRLGRRFANRKFCIVSDRGMISKETMAYLEQEHIPYILGTRMRMVKQIKEEVPSRAGRYWEVRP